MNAFVSSLFFHGASFGTLMLVGIGGGFGNASAPDTLLEVSLMSSDLSGAKVGKVNLQNDFSVEETGNFSTENLQNADVVEEVKVEKRDLDTVNLASKVETSPVVEEKKVERKEVEILEKEIISPEKLHLEPKKEMTVEKTDISSYSLASIEGESLNKFVLSTGEGAGGQALENGNSFVSDNSGENGLVFPQAKILSFKEPKYPQRSRQAGEEGNVKIEVYIDNKGKVEQARILVSSGYERLDNAALKAVEISKYAPIAGYLIVPFIFELKS